ncbi:twin transmembrane helix small protein [Wenzhouxiangella sp. XN24]|uniref:twin transmembrane helix small protein n=1 Tax=Wenzhouxiangella sp. XN24 TaxID=2713569 RepID=UPI00197DA6FA|nr:twin transmembrane helix small protein [Wenzhouxiangella sp. XN24]
MSPIKLLVLIAFAAILFSLASGLVYLFKDDTDSRRVVKALTWRIGLSVAMFVVLLLAYAAGWIEPGNL